MMIADRDRFAFLTLDFSAGGSAQFSASLAQFVAEKTNSFVYGTFSFTTFV